MQGCWTCRVRRKRCEEREGRCSACARLGLSCDGYGPKPHWMDGGDRERLRRAELKATIKLNQARRASKHSQAGSSGENEISNRIDLLQTGVRSQSPATSPSSFDNYLVGSPLFLDEFVTARTPVDDLVTEREVLADANASDGPSNLCHDISRAHEAGGLLQEINETITAHDARFSYDAPTCATAVMCGTVREQPLAHIQIPDQAPNFDQWQHTDMLLFYIEEVFDTEFVFHRFSTSRSGRAWVLDLWRQSPTYGCLTVALCSAYTATRQSRLDCGANKFRATSSWQSFESLGLKRLQGDVQLLSTSEHVIESEKLLQMRVHVLACSIQLIHLTDLTLRYDQVRNHIQASCDILRSISFGTQHFMPHQSISDRFPALPHLAIAVITQDAQLAARVGQPPVLDQSLLEWVQIQFGWILPDLVDELIMFSKVTALAAWKTSCLVRGGLSQFELVKRAIALKSQLSEARRSGLQPYHVLTASSDASKSIQPPGPLASPEVAQISSTCSCHVDDLLHSGLKSLRSTARTMMELPDVVMAYRQAALLYLHIVISGERAPEIHENFLAGLGAVLRLASGGLDTLLCVAWPLSVLKDCSRSTQCTLLMHINDVLSAQRDARYVILKRALNDNRLELERKDILAKPQ